MKVLDLCTGEGGWARGFLAEGWEVVGVDIKPRSPDYPEAAAYVQADLLAFDPWTLGSFDAVVASPWCQPFSAMRHLNPKTRGVPPDAEAFALVARCFEYARRAPVWAVENVRGAIRWWRPLYGEPTNVYRPYYLWTNVAPLPRVRVAPKMGPQGVARNGRGRVGRQHKDAATSSTIPEGVARALARAMRGVAC